MSAKREHPDAAFVADVAERFGAFAPVIPRAMFGGFGLFTDGVMFALVDDGMVYLKTDEVNRPHFVALGLQPWVYQGSGSPGVMSYYPPPEDARDEPEALREWFEGARAAAQRVAATRKPRSRKARR